MPYDVRTSVYEGPFDLLLHLITREEVDLWEVSLSAIVDAYLAEIDAMVVLDLDAATEFLVIAATLVELKTRRLLPGSADIDIDEELALFEERDLLLARLLECKTFRDAGEALARLISMAELSRPRTAGIEEKFVLLAPDLLVGVTAGDLGAALGRALTPKPKPRIDLDHVAPIRASVRDAVEELVDELPRAGTITFRRLTQALVERLDVIVHFLAVLELYTQGRVEIDQVESFGELTVAWVGADGGRLGPSGPLSGRLGADDLARVDSYDG